MTWFVLIYDQFACVYTYNDYRHMNHMLTWGHFLVNSKCIQESRCPKPPWAPLDLRSSSTQQLNWKTSKRFVARQEMTMSNIAMFGQPSNFFVFSVFSSAAFTCVFCETCAKKQNFRRSTIQVRKELFGSYKLRAVASSASWISCDKYLNLTTTICALESGQKELPQRDRM